MARGSGCRVGVDSTGATVATGVAQIRMSFLGARGVAEATPEDPLPGKFNYLIGADPKRWILDVATFERVRYHNVYDGVDVAWYGGDGGLEFDLAVTPGTETSRIAIRFDGAQKLALEQGGDLRIETAAGPLTMRVPAVYQEPAGVRTRVQARYVLRAGNEVGFELAEYDKSRPLVIDPTLVYAAWFDSQYVTVTAMARDTQGNMYVGGTAVWLPTLNAVQGDMGYGDPFVIKFDPTGTTMLYATFVGGTSGDVLNGLAVDSTGNVIATGRATSANFPTVNAAQSTCNLNFGDCGFVFRLNPVGSALVYSTFASGIGNSVAADSNGNSWVALGGSVEKYSPNGTILYTSTLVGGSAITVDEQGFAYLAASAYLSGPGVSTTLAGVPGARDVTGSQCTLNAINLTGNPCTYVAKLSADGTTLVWAAVLGGTGTQTPHAIARDPNSGVVYVAGETTATDLPVTAGVIQPALHGQSDGFLASVSADGSAFGFVTYLGGMADDRIYAMALTSSGQIVVAGDTVSPDFPVSGAIQPAIGGNSVSLLATMDSGNTWTAEGTGLPSSNGAETLSVDPSSPAVFVAATLQGLFRSTDGGASWLPVGPVYAGSSWSWSLSRSLVNPEVLYALPMYGWLYLSTDGGATWASAGYVSMAQSVVASPTDADTVIVIDLLGTVYISTDSGTTLTPNKGELPVEGAPPVASPDGSIYVPIAGYYNGVSGGLVKSTDGGATWQALAWSPFWYAADSPPVYVCTANPAVLYLTNFYNLYRSNDAGLTWTRLNLAYNIAGAPSNCRVVYALGSPFGLQVSADSGVTWSPASGGLTASQYNAIAVDPTNPAHAWVAPNIFPDGFVAKISNDGTTLLWSTFYGGSNAEDVHGVVVDGSGNAWIAGSTVSTDLPLTTGLPQATGPYQSVLMLAEISDATAPCSYYLTPGSAIFYGAGIVNLALTSPSGCAWTATPSDTWITTVNPSAGTASAPIAALLTANNTTATRTGTITVGNQSFTITQPSTSCQYSVDNNAFVLPASGGQVTVNVTAGTGCPWSVVPGGLTVVSGGSGSGNGPVTLSAPPNSGMHAVTYTANVGPTPVTVVVAEDCTYSLSPLTIDGTVINFSITVTASNAACIWTDSTTAAWLTPAGYNTGTGSGTISFYGSTNHTGAIRTANIAIGSQSFTLTQTEDTLPQYALTVLAQPSGAGTVGPNVTADSGTVLCLTESANAGWVFLSWTGATFGAEGSSNCLTLNSNTTVTAIFVSTSSLYFVPMTPCRVVDTRYANGAFGSPELAAGSTRDFAIASGSCNIPATAAAYSLNVTVVPNGALGWLTVWPSGQTQPHVSTLNSADGRIKANAAIVPAGAGGAVSVYVTDATNVILDIDGYFVPAASNATALAFYPLPPCRVADTRYASFGALLGPPSLSAGQPRGFPILSSSCNVPASAAAYSLNFTAVPPAPFLYITTYPTGQTRPLASTLNDPTGTIVANAAIVPAGTGGSVNVYSSGATDMVIDINGYFAPPGAGALSLYNLTPCRALDTRLPSGSPPFSGELDVNVSGSGCGATAAAQAYVFNATVVPPGPMLYLTLWPQGGAEPLVSTLNAPDGAITSNMAIVPTANGSISAYVSVPNTSYLILDNFGYFAP
jgi:hypothetical protein